MVEKTCERKKPYEFFVKRKKAVVAIADRGQQSIKASIQEQPKRGPQHFVPRVSL